MERLGAETPNIGAHSCFPVSLFGHFLSSFAPVFAVLGRVSSRFFRVDLSALGPGVSVHFCEPFLLHSGCIARFQLVLVRLICFACFAGVVPLPPPRSPPLHPGLTHCCSVSFPFSFFCGHAVTHHGNHLFSHLFFWRGVVSV